MQFLYREGDEYVFMDTESYDQLHVRPAALGNAADYSSSRRHRGARRCTRARSSASTSPPSVELTVTETEPGIQGDRVSGARKPATLETGLMVQVPLFVNIGDRVKVDTRSGDYLTRV